MPEPLANYRILDLSALTPGPFATQMLAELGATVLKVERPPDGDGLRSLIPATFDCINRGKYSIAIDLKDPAGRDVFLDLCEGADVVVEGFRPGVMERLGIGFDDIRQRRDDVVYVSISGYGRTGPSADERGHNSNYLARTGMLALSGDRADEPSDASAFQVADLAGSAYAAVSILAALLARSDEAQRLDVPLFSSALAFAQLALTEHAGQSPHPEDSVVPRAANGVFPAGDAQHLTICAVEDGFWSELCDELGRTDLSSRPDLTTYAGRQAHAREINEAVRGALRDGTRDEWLRRLSARGVPVAPVLRPEQVPSDAQVRHLGILQETDPMHVRFPVSGFSSRRLQTVPRVDEHGRRVRTGGWEALAEADS
jgi:crotonobetainyl-CoA:carnitine CoA-transferase CaiB-like acyl-CoA transferase